MNKEIPVLERQTLRLSRIELFPYVPDGTSVTFDEFVASLQTARARALEFAGLDPSNLDLSNLRIEVYFETVGHDGACDTYIRVLAIESEADFLRRSEAARLEEAKRLDASIEKAEKQLQSLKNQKKNLKV